MNLTQKVEDFKLIARDSLRMNLISPRLSAVTNLENDINNINKQDANLDHDLKVLNYDLGKLDTAHPNYEKNKARKEETIKNITEQKADNIKTLECVNKELEEQKASIAKIESGETKVSLELLNDLVTRMIKEDALAQVPSVSDL